MSDPQDPREAVEEEQGNRLRKAVNGAIETAVDTFCEALYDAQLRYGFTNEQITKRLAEIDPGGDWLDWWNEYVEDND